MKVDFIGFEGNRKGHQDWALEIIPETDFEKSFFLALFRSDKWRPTGNIKQMQPIAALLVPEGGGIAVMVSSENYCESELVKAREEIEKLKAEIKEREDEKERKT